jgi:DNA-binding transcriptional regulator PaaX
MSQASEKEMARTATHSSSLNLHGRGELAKEILLMMAAGVAIPAAFLMPGIPKALRPLLKLLSKRCGAKRSEGFIKSLSYLQKNCLVSIAEKDGHQILTLSEDGKRRVLNFNLEQMTIRKPQKWDCYWRIVIFDIPERRKPGREALRSKLKQLGFYQLQKSCFIYPYDCKSEIEFISEMYDVSPHVNFIVAKEIEGAPLLKKSFGLP